jgi:hypothetical protein
MNNLNYPCIVSFFFHYVAFDPISLNLYKSGILNACPYTSVMSYKLVPSQIMILTIG